MPRHHKAHDCPDILIVRRPSGAYGMPIKDGGSSVQAIDFCPFCGKKL